MKRAGSIPRCWDQMDTITAIETQKRRGNRVSIFVDGEFVVGAHEEVVASLGLGVGQTFNRERLSELVRAETIRKARESALRLISYRDRSVSEVRKRLLGNDFPEEIVEEVIDYLSGIELLDDAKFSRDYVKSRIASRPAGKTRLAWELRSRGIKADDLESALGDVDEQTEYRLARDLVAHKLDKADSFDPALRNRLAGFLGRRGFGWEVIRRVLDELLRDSEAAGERRNPRAEDNV